MKKERKNRKTDTFLRYSQPQHYGARDVAGSDNIGFSYKTSMTLIENVIAKKDLQRSIYFEIEGEGKLAVTSASQTYTDKEGKRVFLTAPQIKLITALAAVVDSLIKGNEGYIKELPFKIEEQSMGGDVGDRSTPFKCFLDIPELAKLYYSKNRVGGKQLDDVRKLLLSLAEVYKELDFNDHRGGTLKLGSKLIEIKRYAKYINKDGIEKFNRIEVEFKDVFVYEINDRYSLSPLTDLQLWNETKVNTEFFAVLYYLLKGVRGNFISHSEKAVRAKKKELQKEKVDPQQIEKQIEKLRKQTLTYKESISSLLERVGTKKYLDKNKYIRKDKVEKDLKQAVEALKHIRIIKDYFETAGAAGDKICNFVINDKWLIEEAERMKRSLPPSKAPEKDQK